MNTIVLVSTPSEVEAALIVDTLEAHGIRASMAGGYTASFRAEAPGEVKVLVNAAEAQRAWDVLTEIQETSARIDWDNVDVTEEPPPETEESVSPLSRRSSFQFSLKSLLALQFLTSLILALVSLVKGEAMIAAVVAGVGVGLTILGTIEMASNMERARHVWRTTLGPILLFLTALWLILLLLAGVLQ